MAKISIVASHVGTPAGYFESGDVLTSPPHSIEFLEHLVTACGAAVWVERETKVVTDYEPVKKSPSSPSSPPEPVSRPKTRNSRTGKRPASS